MKIQILISTMYQTDYSLLEKMNIKSDAIVVNQCECNSSCEFIFREYKVKWINTKERGLSKSRNMAIQNAFKDDNICLLADDDLIYTNNYAEIVKKAFKSLKKTSIICFSIEGIEKKFKTYSKRHKYLNIIGIRRVSSVEIGFRLRDILDEEIFFDEDFGSGSKYTAGEENIFLTDCLKNKIKIYYFPKKIADLHMLDSTWFRGYNDKYFFDKGACYYRMYGKLYFIPCIFFVFTKKVFKNINRIKSFIEMIKGKRNYTKYK